jgi:hypothetical protein
LDSVSLFGTKTLVFRLFLGERLFSPISQPLSHPACRTSQLALFMFNLISIRRKTLPKSFQDGLPRLVEVFLANIVFPSSLMVADCCQKFNFHAGDLDVNDLKIYASASRTSADRGPTCEANSAKAG